MAVSDLSLLYSPGWLAVYSLLLFLAENPCILSSWPKVAGSSVLVLSSSGQSRAVDYKTQALRSTNTGVIKEQRNRRQQGRCQLINIRLSRWRAVCQIYKPTHESSRTEDVLSDGWPSPRSSMALRLVDLSSHDREAQSLEWK